MVGWFVVVGAWGCSRIEPMDVQYGSEFRLGGPFLFSGWCVNVKRFGGYRSEV